MIEQVFTNFFLSFQTLIPKVGEIKGIISYKCERSCVPFLRFLFLSKIAFALQLEFMPAWFYVL